MIEKGRRRLAALLATAVLLPAAAQQADRAPVRVQSGDYTVISDVIRASEVNEQIAQLHELPADDDHAILNVTVLEGQETVEADIDAVVVNLIGQAREIEMRDTHANGYIAYFAAVALDESRRLSFELRVVPEAAECRSRSKLRRIFSRADRSQPPYRWHGSCCIGQ